MKMFSVFQLGKNRAHKILFCEFALGMYFSILVIFASAVLFDQIHRVNGSSGSSEIVQLPDNISPQEIADIINSLREIEGAVESRLLPQKELKELLQPWFSEAVLADLSPLPSLIEIKINKTADVDKVQLQKIVGEIAGARLIVLPGVQGAVSPHAFWLLAGLFFMLFFFVIILIGGVVVLVTRTSLLLYSEMVDILDLLGASESFIICQLRLNMLKITAVGGFLGAVLAVSTLLLFFLGSGVVHSELYWVPRLRMLHVFLALVAVAMGLALTWLLVPRVVGREMPFLRKFL